MSSLQQNKDIVRRYNKEFIEGGDVGVHNELMSPAFMNHGGPEGHPSGPDSVLFFIQNVFRPAFPDLKVVIHSQMAEGDRVLTHKSYQGTHRGVFMGVPASDRSVSFDVMEIIELRDGKYVAHWAIPDMLGLMNQIKPA